MRLLITGATGQLGSASTERFRAEGHDVVAASQTGQYGMVIPNFVRQAPAGQPITVSGNGTQSRSFTYVGDVVGTLVKLAEHPARWGRCSTSATARRSRFAPCSHSADVRPP